MSSLDNHHRWMQYAIEMAKTAQGRGEVPVGAVVVRDNQLLGEGHNLCIAENDASAHAEIMAIRAAGTAAGNYRLNGAVLYVTLEPCVMCAGAIVHSRVDTVVFGCADQNSGAAGSVCNLLQTPFLNHQCQVLSGVMEAECEVLLKEFFKDRR